MLKTLMLVGCALVFCILFLPSTTTPQADSAEFFFDPLGRVLGVSEQLPAPAIKINNHFSLPENKNQPNFKTPVRREGSPDFSLASGQGYLWHSVSGQGLFSQAADQEIPIASITKLAIALTFLDLGVDWDKVYTVQAADMVVTGQKYVYPGDKVSVKDLFHLSLIASANSATRALVGSSGLKESEFMKLVNEKMGKLGLKATYLVDPIGLSMHNRSTANELARLTKAALGEGDIAQVVKINKYKYKPQGKPERIAYSTNKFLNEASMEKFTHQGGKTGFTELAGNCFVSKFTTQEGEELISVVMGSQDKNSRFNQTKAMLEWASKSYKWE